MKIKKRILSLALAGTMALGLMPGMSMTALAADGDTSTYTLTIPSTLTVANSGWNATDGISATGSLEGGKKLAVTATSGDEFALVNGENKVGYKLATASTDTEATTSWTFDSLSSTATKKDMGIIVEDYSSKPAGTYQDTVTFTAKVESAVITVTWNNDDITGSGFYGTTFTKDGVTITAGTIDFRDKDFKNGGTFSTTRGNFTKIEVSSGNCSASGTGWSGSSTKKTWTGNASSVSFSGDFEGRGMGNTKLVFTIEPTN